MIKISIIVPIYNVKEYLDECITSIIQQSMKELEIILVDDGSTDGSSAICDRYAKLDDRIKVIHKKNEGLVAARKSGLLVAKGEYIGYVDGDDFAESDMYEKMYNRIIKENADILAVGYKRDWDGEICVSVNEIPSGVYSGEKLEQIYSRMLFNGCYFKFGIVPSVWSKLFRKELLKDIQMAIDDDIQMGEDVACTYPAFLCADKIVIDNSNCSYHYRYVPNSMTTTVDRRYFERAAKLFKGLDVAFEKEETLKRQLEYYKIWIIDLQVKMIWTRKNKIVIKQKKEEMESFYQVIKDYPDYKRMQLPIVMKMQGVAIEHKLFWLMSILVSIEKGMKIR